MRVILTSFHTLPDGPELKPGDDHEFEEAEARRLVAVGGARHPTEEDVERFEAANREKSRAEFRMRLEGQTVEELKAEAAQHNVDLKGVTKKDDIIAVIMAAAGAETAASAGGQT